MGALGVQEPKEHDSLREMVSGILLVNEIINDNNNDIIINKFLKSCRYSVDTGIPQGFVQKSFRIP